MTFDSLAAAESVALVARKNAIQVDQEGAFPAATVDAARAAGLLALTSSRDVGGHGLGMRAAGQVIERIARECGSSAMVLTMHYAGNAVLEAHGSAAVRRDVVAGKHLSTLAFSEAGSRSHFWAPVSSARVTLIAPPTLMPAAAWSLGAETSHSMREGLRDADIIMMLRVQNERINGPLIPSAREYFQFYGLDKEKLAYAKPDALIMADPRRRRSRGGHTPRRGGSSPLRADRGVVELAERRLDAGGDVPHVGDELVADHEAEVDRVAVAHDGDVHPRPLHHRAHRIGRLELGAGEVEREGRAGHVGDHEVEIGRAHV